MIIASLLDLVVSFFHVVFQGLALVDIPQSVVDVFDSVIVYLSQGVQVVACYTHFSYLVVLLDFVVLLEISHTGYIIFMWIMRKVPMWGIK